MISLCSVRFSCLKYNIHLQLINFLKFLLQEDNELLVPEIQKNLGVSLFISKIKRVVNYTDFEKLSHIIEHGLQGLIVTFRNIQATYFY